jgi:ATP-dependent Lhr-like helicase
MLTVMWGPREVGTLDSYFAHLRESEDLVFVLGGKPWQATHIDWGRGLCYVEPAAAGRYPTWMGEPRLLSWELCQMMRQILVDEAEDPEWSNRAREVMQGLRAQHAFLRDEPAPISDEGGRIRWWTYAGGKANNVLARLLEGKLGAKVTASNIAVSFTEGAAKSQLAIRQAVRELRDLKIDDGVLGQLAAGLPRTRVSKFQQCLPARLERALLAETLLDLRGVAVVLRHGSIDR